MGTWRGVELEGLTLTEPGPGGVRLRPYRADDVPAVHAAMQDRSMHAFLGLPDPYREIDAVAWCTRIAPQRAAWGEALELALTGPDDRVVGGAGLALPGPGGHAGEIGWAVHPGARGRGLARRAARLLTAWGFAHGLGRVQVRVAAADLASVRTALGAGFRPEGLQRDGVATPAGLVEAAVLARLPADPGDPVPPWLPPLTDVADDVLALRALRPDDASTLAAELADPEARRWAIGDPPGDVAAAAHRTATRSALGWLVGPTARVAVVDRASAEVVGVLEVRAGGPPDVLELGYGVLAPYRGRGTTARALGLFAAWVFERTGTVRLEVGADVDNLASHRVAERAGFTREGVAPGRLRRADGTHADEVRYALLRRDLTRADPTRADPTRADLTRADPTRADLTRADVVRPGGDRV